ncbi:hypothetical protein PIB30_041979 [Stylosanthes scabra]|uniref:Uncharacterized protein n=1 Tax=Stylosanthes scabra TaxID=79078 RepID=A0ABU6XDV6_9FABA|nr:hypothetical protein [Stylosanthes scabra]
MGFGALSHLPANNLDKQLLKEIYDRYDIRDNTIYSDAAAVKITTRKIGDALGLCAKGTTYETRVVRKKLSQEDQDFGENSKELEARPPWIAYWKGDTLKQRLKQERTHEAGLLKRGQMMAKKAELKSKNPPMRVPPSKRGSGSGSEEYQPGADSEATESNLAANAETEPDPEPEQEAEQIPRREIRSK